MTGRPSIGVTVTVDGADALPYEGKKNRSDGGLVGPSWREERREMGQLGSVEIRWSWARRLGGCGLRPVLVGSRKKNRIEK